MNIGIKLSISLPFVFEKYYLLISGLDRMYFTDVLTIYLAAKCYIRLRCAHNVFVRNIGPVTLCLDSFCFVPVQFPFLVDASLGT